LSHHKSLVPSTEEHVAGTADAVLDHDDDAGQDPILNASLMPRSSTRIYSCNTMTNASKPLMTIIMVDIV
jgi:hypothetical protein